jgi:hypothetical protein
MNSDSEHRRHAIQIVGALPDSVDDALKVLDLARQLVEEFLSGHPFTQRPLTSRPVLAFSSSVTAGNATGMGHFPPQSGAPTSQA